MLVLLPKCPLCIAAWLTAATGVGFSAAGATWVRGMLVIVGLAAVALAAGPIIRRRAFGRTRASTALKCSQSRVPHRRDEACPNRSTQDKICGAAA
jgi:hypothetical protein